MQFGVKLTISKENYLKAIAEAQSEGETVIAASLARWLNVSPPAVTAAIKRLRRDQLIGVAEEGEITLTAAGNAIASRILNRHHLIERMLSEIFGMEWYKVHDEAEQMEHAVSEEFEKRLQDRLGAEDVACPHGNRVSLDSPEERRRRGWKKLDEFEPETSIRITSVYERDRRLLEYLDELGVRPGAELNIVSRNYDETITLGVSGSIVPLGVSAAARIWGEAIG
ncbi:MAG: metal-dependent transcriptional regulator [Bryobacteraceae bacterium]|nr:metal-dependent transcriptional regulator [Bryobacteraceae bacterium]